MDDLVPTLLVAVAIFVGIVGTLLPILPGLLLCWGAVIAYGFIAGFDLVAVVAIAAASLFVALGMYWGVRIPQRHAASIGLGRVEQLGAAACAVVGAFVVPFVGLPLGFVAGIFTLRLVKTQSFATAWSSTKSSMVSMLKASGAQAACGIGVALVWSLWVALHVTLS